MRLLALLERYFQSHHETREIKVYSSTFESIIESAAYNLVLMDIEMPGISGMEARFKIRENDLTMTLLIFVTNMAHFAIDGYKVNALDFCLKPITYEDLFIPMERPAELHSGIALTYTSLIFLAVSALFTSVAAFIGNPEKK